MKKSLVIFSFLVHSWGWYSFTSWSNLLGFSVVKCSKGLGTIRVRTRLPTNTIWENKSSSGTKTTSILSSPVKCNSKSTFIQCHSILSIHIIDSIGSWWTVVETDGRSCPEIWHHHTVCWLIDSYPPLLSQLLITIYMQVLHVLDTAHNAEHCHSSRDTKPSQ